MPSSQESTPLAETRGPEAPSTETIIVDLEGESEHSECAGSMPFKFLNLGPELRMRILREALYRDQYITPYYNTGSLEATEMEVQVTNFDTSVLSTSKQINQEAAIVLYGENIFYFARPVLALWFFAHIGAANLSKVRLVSLEMSSVPFDSVQQRPFDIVDERLWQEVFAWLKPRQRFEEIELIFSLWQSLDLPPSRAPTWNHVRGWSTPKEEIDRHWFQRHQMKTARERVFQILQTYRGLKNVLVHFEPRSSKSRAFFTSHQVRLLILQMNRARDGPVKSGTNKS